MTANGNNGEILCFVWIPGMMLTWITLPHPDPRDSVAAMKRRAAEEFRVREEVLRSLEGQGSKLFEIVEAINSELSLPRAERAEAAELPWWKKYSHEAQWTWAGAHEIIAEYLGAPEPIWDEGSHSWWQDRERHLQWVQSPADVARIKVPDWRTTAPVIRMLEARERWNEAFPEKPVEASSPGYPAFVDLGMYVVGTTRFFTIIGGEPELAKALMDKCFELGSSYAEFLRTLAPEADHPPDLVGFGGDACCLLSPPMYEKYGIGFDLTLLEYLKETFGIPDDQPCNMHSCGPSAHLYDAWGRHPYRDNITVMQTRFLPGTIAKLRHCLPGTRLELTFHPQHYDFLQKTPEEIKEIIWEAARDAEFRDLCFTVIVAANQPADLPTIETNLQVCYETVTEINSRLESGSLP